MLKPIVVVGSINMDLVSYGAHLPSLGETVLGTRFQTSAGGKGANQAVAVARLGYPVSLIGRIGDDAFGDELLQGLKDESIDVSMVRRVPGPSGIASITTNSLGQNTIMVIPGANDQMRPSDIVGARDCLSAAGMVLAQLEIPLETICTLAELCHSYHVPLMLDPAPIQPLPRSLCERVTWLTPNETEASGLLPHLSSVDSLELKLEGLLSLGAECGILKLGGRGVAVSGKGCDYYHFPAFTVEPVDTTAAGDCFNAAFAVACMREMNVFASVRFAAAAAAISVTRVGAQQAMPTTDEVAQFLESHPESRQEVSCYLNSVA